MSRIGKQPVALPSGVKVDVAGRKIKVSGPKGALEWTHPEGVSAAVEDGKVVFSRANNLRQVRAFHGLARALVNNMVIGVTQGYEQKLEVYGTGYSVKKQGNALHLNCGYMGRGYGKQAQFMIEIPKELQVDVEVEQSRGDNDPAKFTIRGIDKQAVGQFAAEIRKIRKPEPYKGKGIRYAGEQVRRKAGKVFAGGG